ncbi:hypothetical protein BJ944DRAFT_171446 [Cunninghamella echinulata]|nr:hypothetical protein BJ944DRAFT_171446 [Cunninghamella echinulata]
MIGSGFISRSNSPALTSSSYEVLPVVLCVPSKKTRSIKFGPSLLDYITNAYAEDANKYKEDCRLLDKLREEAIIQLPEVIDIAAIDRLFM